MQLVRLPFTISELPGSDAYDMGRLDEHPPTRPGKGESRKVRGPRKGQS
jgi:hypothetical protein